MRIQTAIVERLKLSTSATYALAVARSYWTRVPDQPTMPFVRVRKTAFQPLTAGIKQQIFDKGTATIEVACFAKTQEAAADLGDAVRVDLVNYSGTMPVTSPATANAPYVHRIELINEEDALEAHLVENNIYVDVRTYQVEYRET